MRDVSYIEKFRSMLYSLSYKYFDAPKNIFLSVDYSAGKRGKTDNSIWRLRGIKVFLNLFYNQFICLYKLNLFKAIRVYLL